MSDHETPDESGTNRTWLSLFVVALALLLGAMAWNQGHAAPRPPSFQDVGPKGAVVLEGGQGIVHGTVLLRGAGVVVIDDKGNEHAYPWSQVHYVEKSSTQLPPEALKGTPYAAQEGSTPHPGALSHARMEEGGTVILKSGEVYVGRISVDSRTVTVRWPYKGRTAKGEVSFPRDQIRWYGFGVEGPTRAYWHEFPHERVVGYTNPLMHHPLLVEAEMAQNEGRWAEATRRWADLYKAEGFKRVHFLNLQTCAKNWIRYAGDIGASEAAARKLADVYLAGLTSHPGVRDLLGSIYAQLAKICLECGRNKSVRELADRLEGLGGKWTQQGETLRQRLRGE